MTHNAPEEWLNYEDFAAGIDTNRLPRSAALVGQVLAFALDNGRKFRLHFTAADAVSVQEAGQDSAEWCEVVNTTADTWFVDLTFAARPTEAETLIFNTATRRVLSVHCRIRPAGAVQGEPRVAQDWVAGRLEGGTLAGAAPAPTRDLIGLRAFYTYSPNHVYEHTYLSSERYGWQNLKGVQRGHGDTDLATTFKFADDQYVFGFREFIIPVASVFFYDFSGLRSTGKFLGETAEARAQNSPAGAFIQKASMTYYPAGLEPV